MSSPLAATAPRDPLSPLDANTTLLTSAHNTNASASSPLSSTSKLPSTVREKKLAPIFLRRPRGASSTSTSNASHPSHSSPAPGPAASSSHLQPPATSSPVEPAPGSEDVRACSSSPTRKRARLGKPVEIRGDLDPDVGEAEMDVDEEAELDLAPEDDVVSYKVVRSRGHARVPSVTDWFLPSTPSRTDEKRAIRARFQPPTRLVEEDESVWRRPRRRHGLGGFRGLVTMAATRPIAPQQPFLSTLVQSLAGFDPYTPPSILLLPSLHPPTGRPRDFAPALSVSFNSVAKAYNASEAASSGRRRLIAVAGEEGGVRILDVDEGLGNHREEKGWWWRAHSNAVFDIKWAADDARILTASGDQTTRIHALTSPTPTVIASLRGHTSSVKTAVFFDPSRCHSDPSTSSSIVASSGRDGNILIYDLRSRGRVVRDEVEGLRRSSRERDRYAAGVPGFAAQQGGNEVDPVMVIKAAHGDGARRAAGSRTATRSVTSLVALQAMPGILASGGSFDGIVKLWDLRFPAATSRSPEPRPSCTPFAALADPTTRGSSPSRRPRSINALAESPTTGDLFALCGDSKVHVLRPSCPSSLSSDADDSSASKAYANSSVVLPRTYADPSLLVSSFYLRVAVSPDGKHLAAGSGKGGVMAWEIDGSANEQGEVGATRLPLGQGQSWWPRGREREVSAVDWGKDMLAACSDDLATRIWRSDPEKARKMRADPHGVGAEWLGAEEA